MSEEPLWTPSRERREASNLQRFMRLINERNRRNIADFEGLHAFSVEKPEAFWTTLWDFCGIRAQTRGERVLVDPAKIPGARFFPDARLNYARNLLVRSDDAPALVFRGEDKVRKSLTWRELNDLVSRLQQAMEQAGVKVGDRVAAIVPNMPETIATFLAAASIGAIWSSCSPDFGEHGILDRFGQIAPKLLVACDGYHYGGKTFDLGDKISAVLEKLPSVERVVVIDYVGHASEIAARIGKATALDDFIAPHAARPVAYAELPFDHPLYILYSSGTTGVPKCIVHRAGGILLKHLSEHVLHTDLKPEDRLFYFTTCGWMMWNWLVTGLSAGGTLLLFDGSPFHPSERAIFDFAEEEGMTIFGTSAKYIDAVKKSGWEPRSTHALPKLRTMLSTGSPLAPESFDFVYRAIKPDLHLASISGGTDICGCFVAGNPLGPVWRGEIQAPTLGLAVDVYDEEGRHLSGGKGELVCRNAFPSMPLMFWNDPDGEKYHNAYFARFPSTWCHGDFAE
ncbi:MAG: acetoacetate--CoA ligase, partial [Parvibaculaceae bacterium]